MRIDLEQICCPDAPYCFRLGIHSDAERSLLRYPHPTGLRFSSLLDPDHFLDCTPFFGQFPQDDFVLSPSQQIMFDLIPHVNPESRHSIPWSIELESGAYLVHYEYHVDRETDWYDFLAKRSRFSKWKVWFVRARRRESFCHQSHD